MTLAAVRFNENNLECAIDSQITERNIDINFLTNNQSSKAIDCKDLLIFSAGYRRMGVALEVYLNSHSSPDPSVDSIFSFLQDFYKFYSETLALVHPSSAQQLDNEGNTFLIIFKNEKRVFRVVHNYSIQEIKTYHSIGCDSHLVDFAMFMGLSPQKAIEEVSKFSIYSSAPVSSWSFDLTPSRALLDKS